MPDDIKGPFYDVILPIDHVSLTLNGVTSFLRVINIRNTCQRLRHSQIFGRGWSGFNSARARKWSFNIGTVFKQSEGCLGQSKSGHGCA